MSNQQIGDSSGIFPLMRLEQSEARERFESPGEDLLQALKDLNQPSGTTVDSESNVYSRGGMWMGLIIPHRTDSMSPKPVLYTDKYVDLQVPWHRRMCVTCELRDTYCCKQH